MQELYFQFAVWLPRRGHRLKHAIRGVTKRIAQASKPRRGITRRMLLQVCWHARDEGQAEEALIYAFSFVFLLRVANESLFAGWFFT